MQGTRCAYQKITAISNSYWRSVKGWKAVASEYVTALLMVLSSKPKKK